MKKLALILLLALSNTLAIAASSPHSWDKDLLDIDLDLNSLELRNRAGCAVDSKNPTKSAFLLVDNTTMAKATYRLAKLTGLDHEVVTKEAIKNYRSKIKILFSRIFSKLKNRELPLLMVNSSKRHIPSKYQDIIESCYDKNSCEDLNEYLSKLWLNSESTLAPVKKILNNYNVDNFHSEENYFDQKYNTSDFRVSCNQLKKFSPLQAHLYGTKPDREVLQKIAESLKDTPDYISSCENDEIENLKVLGIQYDIRNVNDKYWNEVGFDFWNSLKIYLAWSFKNISVVDEQYELVIQSTQMEDSILLTSNGCKTIEPPECSNEYLSKSVMSQMAQKNFKKNALNLDVLAPVVNGASDMLLDDPFTAVNTDILDLSTRSDANEWIESLFSNFAGTKAYIKNKLVSALSFYTIIEKKVTTERLINDLNAYYSKKGLTDQRVKNDLYYLCSEVKFVSDETFSFVKKNIDLVRETGFIDSLSLIFSEQSLENLFEDYEALTKATNTFCDNLDAKAIWDDSFEYNKSGLAQWYLDKTLVRTQMTSTQEEQLKSLNPVPYLKYAKTDSVICHSPSSCIRNSIAHILEITRATYYASTFWNAKNKAKTEDLFNPYAERVACKVYDPWFKTRATLTNFVSDISQAVVSRFTPGVLYSKVSLLPGHVTSFNTMVKDGKILFNQKYKKESVSAELIADFGPLLGVPCAVSVSGNQTHGYNQLYQFSGISVGACSAKEENEIMVTSASDISANDPSKRAGCVSCQLNFESVSNTLSYFNYAVGPIYYLVRSFVRLYQGIKDPDNIPRSWDLNLEYLKQTYSRFGYIPKKCVKKLSKGQICLDSYEEEVAVKHLIDNYDVKILSEQNRFFSGIEFKVQGCSHPVLVSSTSSNNDRDSVTEVSVKTKCKLKAK